MPAEVFQLLVRHARTLTVNEFQSEDDVESLQVAVERKTGLPSGATWLAFAGRRLEAGRSLSSYGLRAGSQLQLSVRGRGGGCGTSKESPGNAHSEPPPAAMPAMPAGPAVTQIRLERFQGAKAKSNAAVVLRELSALDDRLVATLEKGDIALVRSAWVLQPSVDRMLWRQELEQLARSGASPSPLLEPGEAAALVRRCDRSAGALTVRRRSNPGCAECG